MQNLEDISFTEVRHPRSSSYAEWRKNLKPDYNIVYRDMIFGYAALAIILYLSTLLPPDRLFLFIGGIVICSILIGLTLAYLSLFLHEAGHFNLHRTKRANEIMTLISLGALFGIDIRSYRKIHWQHHLHLGTTADTETSYYRAPDASFFLESLTGIYLLKVIRNKSNLSILTKKMKSDSLKMVLIGGMINILIAGGFVLGNYWAAAISWVVGMLIFFPFFAALRQVLEHRNEFASEKMDFTKVGHGKISRIFGSDFFSSVFGGAGFNKHMIHHWDPQISYTRLREIEAFLMECEVTRHLLASSRTTYMKTFRKLAIKKS